MEYSIEIMKKIIPAVAGGLIDDYIDELDNASDFVTHNILGSVLMDSVNDDPKLSAKTTRVIYLKAFLERIPVLDLVLTDSGFAVTGNKNFTPASRARVDALIAQIKTSLDNAIENLFLYLEETTALHVKWKQSNAYSILSGCFIRTLTKLNTLISFSGNRDDFKRLQSEMLNYQRLVIHNKISKEYCNHLLTSSELTDNDKEIIKLLQFATANYLIGNQRSADIYITQIVSLLKDADNYPIYKESALFNQVTSPYEVSESTKVIGFGL